MFYLLDVSRGSFKPAWATSFIRAGPVVPVSTMFSSLLSFPKCIQYSIIINFVSNWPTWSNGSHPRLRLSPISLYPIVVHCFSTLILSLLIGCSLQPLLMILCFVTISKTYLQFNESIVHPPPSHFFCVDYGKLLLKFIALFLWGKVFFSSS
jgi:hypothetical protein